MKKPIPKKVLTDQTVFVKALWAETFNLPPNDARLLKLTPREAYEQVRMVTAIKRLKAQAITEGMQNATAAAQVDPYGGPSKPVVKTVMGFDAEKIADKPLLTGDPEWDAVEREETAEFREPFDIERFRDAR